MKVGDTAAQCGISFRSKGKCDETNFDDGEMFERLTSVEFSHSEIDSLDLSFEHRRLKLEIEIQHRLRLRCERLRFGLLRRLMRSFLLEIAVAR